MTKIPLEINREKVKNFCKKYPIAYLPLFGSILTSHFTASTESELSSIVGRRVDVKTPKDLNFQNEVLANANVLYKE